MNLNDETSDDDEMTDRQLDLLLTTANEELLGRIQAAADPGRTLVAIMSINASVNDHVTPPTLVVLAIGMRSKAHALVLALDFDLDRTHDFTSDLVQGLADAPDRAVARARDLCLTLGRSRDLTRDLARDLARDPELDTARDLNGDLHIALDLLLHCIHDVADVLDRDRDRANDVIRGLDRDLGCACAKARDLGANLQMQRVDASGADLSGLVIQHVEVLNGIIWTHQTTWPSSIVGQVRSRSEEIRPGVYQVRIDGKTPQHSEMAAV